MKKQRNKNREFGLTVSVVLLLIAAYQYISHHHFYTLLTLAGVVLVALAIAIPKSLYYLRLAWEKLGQVLGAVNSFLILLLVYFLVLTPIAVIMKLTGKDVLGLKRKNKKSSYWIALPEDKKTDMRLQY